MGIRRHRLTTQLRSVGRRPMYLVGFVGILIFGTLVALSQSWQVRSVQSRALDGLGIVPVSHTECNGMRLALNTETVVVSFAL